MTDETHAEQVSRHFEIRPIYPSPHYGALMNILHHVHRNVSEDLFDQKRFAALPQSESFRFKMQMKDCRPHPMFGQLKDAFSFNAHGWSGESKEDVRKVSGPVKEDFEEILEEITACTIEENLRKIDDLMGMQQENEQEGEEEEGTVVVLQPAQTVPPKIVPPNVCEMCRALRGGLMAVPYPLVILAGEVLRGRWHLDVAKYLYDSTMACAYGKQHLQVCPEHIHEYIDFNLGSRLPNYMKIARYLHDPHLDESTFIDKCTFFEYWYAFDGNVQQEPKEVVAERLMEFRKGIEDSITK